jgi:hypothetical protein
MARDKIIDDDDEFGDPVDIPPAVRYGNFFKVGQTYDGVTVSFTRDEGRNAKDEPCPEIVQKLVKPAVIYRDGEPTTVPVDEEVTITGGPWMLAQGLRDVNPQVGERIKIAFEGMQGQSKVIKVYPPKKRGVTYDDLKAADGSKEGPPPF